MTIFTPPDNVQAGDNQEPASYLEALVGDGKKFADLEALAKGKYESDNKFVPQLLQEAKQRDAELLELREQLKVAKTMEEFMDKIESRSRTPNQDTPGDGDGDPNGAAPHNAAPSEQTIAELVRKSLAEVRSRATAMQNLQTTAQALKDAWGPDYIQTLNAKRQELGLTEDFMNDVAARSPKALLNLVGVQKEASPNSHLPPRSTQVPQGGYQAAPTRPVRKNRAYYNEMLKKDRAKYYSPDVQAEKMRMAVTMGADFDK
mgnify:FL=1